MSELDQAKQAGQEELARQAQRRRKEQEELERLERAAAEFIGRMRAAGNPGTKTARLTKGETVEFWVLRLGLPYGHSPLCVHGITTEGEFLITWSSSTDGGLERASRLPNSQWQVDELIRAFGGLLAYYDA